MRKLFFFFLCFLVQTTLSAFPQYYCTAANETYFKPLINLIGSVHKHNYDNVQEIAVYDLGMTKQQLEELKNIRKVRLYSIKDDNPNLLRFFSLPASAGRFAGKKYLGWYAWKPVVIKEALETFPYVLWIDAGSVVLKPLDDLFAHIEKEGYFLNTIGDERKEGAPIHSVGWSATRFVKEAFHLSSPENAWILDQESVMGGFLGVAKKSETLFLQDWHALTKEIRHFADDGTTQAGWGSCRHDQTLLSILAYQKGLKIHQTDSNQATPALIQGERGKEVPFYLTWDLRRRSQGTSVMVQAGCYGYAEHLKSIRSKVEKPYTLSICAIFKNEAPYFKEWIEYHKLVGVDHFYLYNNGSEDHYQEVLAPYIKAGEVTLIDFPDRDKSLWQEKIWAWVYATQVPAYEDAFRLAKDSSKWIAAIDIDEFIVPVKAGSIVEVLEKYGAHFPGLEVNWRVYGTSGFDQIPEGMLMIEVLNKKSFASSTLNRSCKTILRPDLYKSFFWPPHRCDFIDSRQSYSIDTKELVINHYINRCKSYFLSHKVKNKEHMDNVKLSEQQIAEMLSVGNDLEDHERHIHRFVPALREKMALKSAFKQVDLIADFDVEPFRIFPDSFKNTLIHIKPTLSKSSSPSTTIIFNQVVDPAALSHIPRSNLVYFLWEPWEVPASYYDLFSKVYTWNDDLVDNVKFFKFHYPHLMPMEKNLPSFEEKKLCVMIAGADINPVGRKNDLYTQRLKMVEFFETKPKGELEIYGKQWKTRFYRDYISPIPGWHSGAEKIATLKNYRFSICFENTKNINGYITEKIFGCFAAGCVPIYYGASNITSYIPKGCYIDYRDFANNEELYQFIKQMPKSVYEKYLDNIRAFLSSEQAKVFSMDHFLTTFHHAMGS